MYLTYRAVVKIYLLKHVGGHITARRSTTFLYEVNNLEKCYTNHVNLW